LKLDILKISEGRGVVNKVGMAGRAAGIKELEISPKFLIQFLISSPLIS
jgi:hypothetical protein